MNVHVSVQMAIKQKVIQIEWITFLETETVHNDGIIIVGPVGKENGLVTLF